MSVFSTFVKARFENQPLKLAATNINTSGPLVSSTDKAGFGLDQDPLMPLAQLNSGPDLPWRSDCKSLQHPLFFPWHLASYRGVCSQVAAPQPVQQVTSQRSLEALGQMRKTNP